MPRGSQKHRNYEAMVEDLINGVPVKVIAWEWFAHESTVRRTARAAGIALRGSRIEERLCRGCGVMFKPEKNAHTHCSRKCYLIRVRQNVKESDPKQRVG